MSVGRRALSIGHRVCGYPCSSVSVTQNSKLTEPCFSLKFLNFNLFNTKFLFFCWLHRKKISSLYPQTNYETIDQHLVDFNEEE